MVAGRQGLALVQPVATPRPVVGPRTAELMVAVAAGQQEKMSNTPVSAGPVAAVAAETGPASSTINVSVKYLSYANSSVYSLYFDIVC